MGLVLLPIIPMYLTWAVLAGGLVGIGWIVVIKTDGRIQLGYIGVIAIPLIQMVARDRFLPEGSGSMIYGFFFAAVAIAVGLGAALIYREIRERG